MTYRDFRYVREVNDDTQAIEDWHEMEGGGNMTLCGVRLDPGVSMQFNFLLTPPRFQHQRGTGFPPGNTCEGCVKRREWMDLESRGPIYDDAESHF